MSGGRDNHDDGDRRSFTSRTPEATNPERVTYRRGFVTRHQVTGWRFVMRRIASGVALHDTRMLVDPLRTQSRAVLMGVLLLITGVIGCFVFSLIRPGGAIGNNTVLADRDTSALYVRVDEALHPVLNLTSARLIAGQDVNPTVVRSTALDGIPRGVLVGIPGAPERMVQTAGRDANWTLCDSSAAVGPGLTVIAGVPEQGGERAAALPGDQAVLVAAPGDAGATWLLWDGRRSPIDLADRAVTAALGLGANIPAAQSISAGLFNAIPEGAPLRAPAIPAAGTPPQVALSVPVPVGAVVVAYGAEGTMLYYAVLADGLQPISPVLAALLRNTNSYGLEQPPRLGADEVARTPVSDILDTTAFPDQRVSLVDATASPVTCVHWSKGADASTSSLALLSGAALPVAENTGSVELVGAGPGAATRVVLPTGTGFFVQTVGQEAQSPTAGSLFWVADTGVRYGLEAPNQDEMAKTIAALGLKAPATPIPWSVLALFAAGPALSQADARNAYSGTEIR